jgi:hypothetical protein
MAGGPPGTGGPPAGGGGGGPPPRTPAEQLVDKIFETVFPLLYAFEPEGMLDSEKNLRVLWVRALLAAAGELEDDVAAELLPSATRWVVSAPLARTLWAPVLPKLAWIKQRTQFIDAALDDFLAKTAATTPLERVQVVLIGSGYDTRALRYREAGARFFEVDLPSVLPIKEAMARRYLSSMARREAAASDEADGADAADAADAAAATSVGGMGRALGLDLNKATMAPPGDIAQLEAMKAMADLAKVINERDRAQLAIQAISKNVYDTSTADMKAKRAQVEQQIALVAKKNLKAPFSGRVGIVTINPGHYVNPGDKLLTLQTIDPIQTSENC